MAQRYITCAPATQETTDAYADLTNSKLDAYEHNTVCYVIKNTDGANSIDWKVLGSNDDSEYVEVQAEAAVAAGAVGTFLTATAYYRYYKVQIKATVGGSQGDADLTGHAKI